MTKLAKKVIFVFDRVVNTVEKGETAAYKHFLLFPTVFSKAFYFRFIKGQVCVVKSFNPFLNDKF